MSESLQVFPGPTTDQRMELGCRVGVGRGTDVGGRDDVPGPK